MNDDQYAAGEGGARIRMRVEGPASAPAILLCHSLGVSMDTWNALAEAFSGSYRIVRYDTRGHGGSDAPPGPYNLAMLAGDALAVLDSAAVGRAHVVGLSMGGMIGMWLATHAPQRVQRLVVANSTAHIPLRDMWNSRIETALSSGMDTIAAATLNRWLGEDFKTAEAGTCAAMIEAMRQMSATGYAGCCAALRDADQRETVGRIAAPTLVLTGTADLATTPAVAESLAASIPGARAGLIDGAGHLSNVEKPLQFNRLVREFLA